MLTVASFGLADTQRRNPLKRRGDSSARSKGNQGKGGCHDVAKEGALPTAIALLLVHVRVAVSSGCGASG